MVTGDSDQFHWGTGTFASRGAVVAGNAVHAAAKAVREKALRLAAEQLGVARGAVELAEGQARVGGGEPARSIALGELAKRANPMRGAVKPGTEPGLEATRYFGPDRGATASGVPRHDRRGRSRDLAGARSRSTSWSTTAAGCSTR